jgi:hypothetical protein
MEFESAAPSIIKSVKQRDLLNSWLRLHTRTGCVPRRQDYQPERLADESKELVYYDIDRTTTPPRVIIASSGSRLANAYGKAGTNNTGTSLTDYLPPSMRSIIMPAYYACVARQLPVYTISMIDDVNGCAVAYERMLLPFSDGDGVSHIIASLKAISEDGGFEIKDLLLATDRPPVYKLRAVIDTSLIQHPPSLLPPDDVVEI